MAYFPPLLGALRTAAVTPMRFASFQRNHYSLITLFCRAFKKEFIQGAVKVKYIPKEKLQEICDRNFNRKLAELVEKSKETVKSSPPKSKT